MDYKDYSPTNCSSVMEVFAGYEYKDGIIDKFVKSDNLDTFQLGNNFMHSTKNPIQIKSNEIKKIKIDYKPNKREGKWDEVTWNSKSGDCIADYLSDNNDFKYIIDPVWGPPGSFAQTFELIEYWNFTLDDNKSLSGNGDIAPNGPGVYHVANSSCYMGDQACFFSYNTNRLELPNDLTYIGGELLDEFTINLVAKLSTCQGGSYDYLFGNWGSATPSYAIREETGEIGQALAMLHWTSSELGFHTTTNACNEGWVMLTFVYNTTDLIYYFNGTYSDKTARTGNTGASGSGTTYLLGGGNDYLDDVAVYNLSMNSSDVSLLFNSGDIKTPFDIYEIINLAPNNPTDVELNSTTANQLNYTDENLTANFLCDDPDTTDTLTYDILFYKDGIEDVFFFEESCSDPEYISFVLSSGNTTKGEKWSFSVNVTDAGGLSSSTIFSNNLTIENSPPTIPLLNNPNNNSAFSTLPEFNWSNSTDLNGDFITYIFEISNFSDFSALEYINLSVIETDDPTEEVSINGSLLLENDGGYYWRVKSNDSDGSESDYSEVRFFTFALFEVTFNLTDSDTGEQLDTSGGKNHFDVSCTNGFSADNVDNPYNATDAFELGSHTCTFSDIIAAGPADEYLDKEFNFTVNNNNEVFNFSVDEFGGLSAQEHDWLEALYNCLVLGQSTGCESLQLLLSINETVSDIWQKTTPTDPSVVTQEDILSDTLSSTSNISINYTINIPFKTGFKSGELLPLRLFFWFHDNTTCYSQDKIASNTNRAEAPYCVPLTAELLGPNNGSANFIVDLRPNLSDGAYNFTRSIEIDPIIARQRTWHNYGQEVIGNVNVLESTKDATITFSNIALKQPLITGAAVAITSSSLTAALVVIIALLLITLITIIFIKKT